MNEIITTHSVKVGDRLHTFESEADAQNFTRYEVAIECAIEDLPEAYRRWVEPTKGLWVPRRKAILKDLLAGKEVAKVRLVSKEDKP